MTRRIDRRLLWGLVLGVALALMVAFWFLRAEQARFAEAQAESARNREETARTIALAPVEALKAEDAPADSRSSVAKPPVVVGAQKLELLIASSAGTPVPSAQLVIFRGEERIATATSDSKGLAQFSAGAGSAELAVFAPGWTLLRTAIELEPGHRTVTLPDGALLGGRVLLDGAPPRVPIEIRFDSSPPPEIALSPPKCAMGVLGSAIMKHGLQYATTDANGAFAIRGLVANMSGDLTWDDGYFLDRGGKNEEAEEIASLHVAALQPDLELRLVSGTELRLRVVDPKGAALPKANVSVKILSQPVRSLSMLNGVTDAEGRFRCAVGRKPPIGAELQISAPDRSGLALYKFDCPPGTRGAWDVGELAITATRTISLHVQDSDGAAIADAQAVPLPSRAYSAARSDANGNLELVMGDEDQQLLAQAVGYGNAIVEAPIGTTQASATLVKACLLQVKVLGNEGADPIHLAIRVSGPPPIFTEDSPGAQPVLQDPYQGVEHADKGPASSYRMSLFRSPARLAGLRPGIALKAELHSSNGPVLGQVDIAPLAAGEHRTVELVMNRQPKSLRILVLDPDQRPVTGAEVYIKDSPPGGGRTDGTGVFVMSSIYADYFALRIEASGFPTKFVYGVSTPPETLTVVLDAPRSLEVELVDLEGAPVTGTASVSAGQNEWYFQQGQRTAEGRWNFNGLPADEVVVRATSSKFPPVTLFHDTAEPFLRIVLGNKGRVSASLEAAPEWSANENWFAIGPAGTIRAQARERIRPKDGRYVGSFNGLAFGSYDIWLETRAPQPPCDWTRISASKRVVLDAEHPQADVELRP